jgi:hypothetical protein
MNYDVKVSSSYPESPFSFINSSKSTNFMFVLSAMAYPTDVFPDAF